jgi:O-acetyl-ADP-ribose deacetylase (regulator of RNase III)
MIEVRVDDLVFVNADAILWPVTAELRATTPLLRRLEGAGGRALASQLVLQEPLPVGSAVVTGAGELGAGLLIHAVVSSDTDPVTKWGVRRALTSALQRAADWEIAHLACTPFGLGAGNFEIEESAEIMIEVIREHLERAKWPTRVTIVVETSLEESLFASSLARVRS